MGRSMSISRARAWSLARPAIRARSCCRFCCSECQIRLAPLAAATRKVRHFNRISTSIRDIDIPVNCPFSKRIPEQPAGRLGGAFRVERSRNPHPSGREGCQFNGRLIAGSVGNVGKTGSVGTIGNIGKGCSTGFAFDPKTATHNSPACGYETPGGSGGSLASYWFAQAAAFP